MPVRPPAYLAAVSLSVCLSVYLSWTLLGDELRVGSRCKKHPALHLSRPLPALAVGPSFLLPQQTATSEHPAHHCRAVSALTNIPSALIIFLDHGFSLSHVAISMTAAFCRNTRRLCSDEWLQGAAVRAAGSRVQAKQRGSQLSMPCHGLVSCPVRGRARAGSNQTDERAGCGATLHTYINVQTTTYSAHSYMHASMCMSVKSVGKKQTGWLAHLRGMRDQTQQQGGIRATRGAFKPFPCLFGCLACQFYRT
ncbi:hypothetical protein IWX92DRAFT_358113, partial [Phyllosticta citricarpa]